MVRWTGTTVRGLRAPIVREGDDLVRITVDTVLNTAAAEGFALRDRDVVGVTESLLARSQGNYTTVDAVAEDVRRKLPGDFVVLFPILSRNRFSVILKGLARSGRRLTLLLNYPGDEVGNHLMDVDEMDAQGINPYSDVLTEEDFRCLFGHRFVHPFTGMDYIDLYKGLAVEDNIRIVLANDYRTALRYSPDVLVANIHDRARLKRKLVEAGARTVIGLDDLVNTPPPGGGGYNPDFGLLGSNQAGDERLKLFPRDCRAFADAVQARLRDATGRTIEVMVYGDGAFKDPQGKIWELADPLVSPGYTPGLDGTPNELKMKYIVDNELADLDRESAAEALRGRIRAKGGSLVGQSESLGTTPRQITDLLGTLCDLTSGSGDKGTPIILVQGYFDNFATE
ncbi:MAG: coenzyme F420-0:L-glutamate ligase [Clostridia bacterium]|nr:coenzyme F420-0:L-glutamate ligase [Clostridia bacterium]